jgi:hypothetical protein
MSAEASGCGSLTTAGAVVGYWKMSATYYRACLMPGHGFDDVASWRTSAQRT